MQIEPDFNQHRNKKMWSEYFNNINSYLFVEIHYITWLLGGVAVVGQHNQANYPHSNLVKVILCTCY